MSKRKVNVDKLRCRENQYIRLEHVSFMFVETNLFGAFEVQQDLQIVLGGRQKVLQNVSEAKHVESYGPFVPETCKSGKAG